MATKPSVFGFNRYEIGVIITTVGHFANNLVMK